MLLLIAQLCPALSSPGWRVEAYLISPCGEQFVAQQTRVSVLETAMRAEWQTYRLQSELHTAPPLTAPEMTHFLEKPGQAKEEVSEYIQMDLHFIL